MKQIPTERIEENAGRNFFGIELCIYNYAVKYYNSKENNVPGALKLFYIGKKHLNNTFRK